MEAILSFLGLVFAPLSIGIVFTAVFAGIFLGALYNYQMNIPEDLIFHKAVAGWTFIFFILVFRIASTITEGIVLTNYIGWIGIAILWGIYIFGIWIGQRLVKKVKKQKI